ncbi:FAD-binding oxidoreductase [Terricaulis sp.]|uniref:FAD-binding oxidoreductase n=1 Tax=Terricaulis sp. TaxID=2768686 RepID=UPI003782EE42
MLDAAKYEAFKANFRGELITPRDAAYNDARALYNAMIDKKPAVIARVANVADVIAAVNFARDNGLLVAIRGGGHNGPGLGSCNDGLVIDCARLKGVRVDAATRTVRVEPGCTQGDVEHAAHAFGLAVPAGIVSSTGVAGLTLGGGTGYLSRAYGLTIDNLLEADVVLADGRFVTASEKENADLFWALRGGGGNFGVVTSFLFKAHPVKNVYSGPIFWDLKDAKKVVQVYRDNIAKAPVELGLFVGMKTVPSVDPFPREHWGKRVVALIGAYNGSVDNGVTAMKPFRDALPAPLFDWMSEMPFSAMQGLFDGLMPKGLQWYWKGDFVKELPDAAIDVHIEHMARAPSDLSLVHLYPIDGAVQKVAADATPWGARDARFSMVIAAIHPDPAQADNLKKWGRAYWEAIHPYNMGGAYVNFMSDDEAEGRVQASYGPNYARLQTIKKKYDPTNFFRVNQNIKPA